MIHNLLLVEASSASVADSVDVAAPAMLWPVGRPVLSSRGVEAGVVIVSLLIAEVPVT